MAKGHHFFVAILLAVTFSATASAQVPPGSAPGSNPIIRDKFTADPAPLGPWTYRGELTGSGKYSFTIHPGIARFKGDWYLFLHNATLAIGDLNGAIGRRAVTVEHLRHNADGTMKPVAQTQAGVTVPPPR